MSVRCMGLFSCFRALRERMLLGEFSKFSMMNLNFSRHAASSIFAFFVKVNDVIAVSDWTK